MKSTSLFSILGQVVSYFVKYVNEKMMKTTKHGKWVTGGNPLSSDLKDGETKKKGYNN